MSITSLHCFGGREGRCWHACFFYIRSHFGTGAILRVPILKEFDGCDVSNPATQA